MDAHPPNAAATPLDHLRHPLERDACLRLEQALFREWLETDGLGGYASSSVHLCPTRRYHGLLVAPLPGGGERHVFLSRFEEEVFSEDRGFPLSTGRYKGMYAPEGYQSIEHFGLGPFPTWTYQIGRVTLTREIQMLPGRHAVLVRWTRTGGPSSLRLRLRPLLAFRRFHDLTYENVELDPRVQRREEGTVATRPYSNLPELLFSHAGSSGAFHADPLWYRGIELVAELRRGFPGHEDGFCPGWFELDLPDGGEVVMGASLFCAVEDPIASWHEVAAARREEEAANPPGMTGALALAAPRYLYRDHAGRSGVIAGYPWFGEWGRDTFIALPGLTLTRGRLDQSMEVLESALPFLKDGLLPNIYGATPGSSQYRSADAALWFSRAALLHQRATGDAAEVRARFRGPLESIAEAYLRGTQLGLRVDEDGLLHAGDESLNATWMDAMVDGKPVTPRAGSPVELQALWYQLLAHLDELATADGDSVAAQRWRAEAARAGVALRDRFWMPDRSYLADGIREDQSRDTSLRPNAVMAAALEYSPLTTAERADVVQLALDRLLTPRGLRTLAPEDPRYVGRYEGGPEERDGAYHQGTVWPWPLGFLVEAALRAFPANGPRVGRLRQIVEGLAESLNEHGLGQLSEIFDGDPPHRPAGTPAQAWSVAELLRAYALLRERGA